MLSGRRYNLALLGGAAARSHQTLSCPHRPCAARGQPRLTQRRPLSALHISSTHPRMFTMLRVSSITLLQMFQLMRCQVTKYVFLVGWDRRMT